MAHRLLPRPKGKTVDKELMKKMQTAAEKELFFLQGLMETLVQNRGDIDRPNGKGKTCLQLALEGGHKKLVGLLLQMGVVTNTEDELGNSPLFAAVANGDEDVVKGLLDRETDFRRKNPQGHTVTYWAAKHNARDVAIVFKNMGVNLTYEDVCDAAKHGHKETIKMLKGLETDFTALNIDGRSALHRAAFENKSEVLRYFLVTGNSVDVKDVNDRTPLHHATFNNCEAAMKLLVLAGANINARDITGRTPLHLAAFCDNVVFVRHLVEQGATVNLKDAIGKTPLQLARGRKRKLIIDYLQSKETV